MPRASAECLSRCGLSQGGWGGRRHLPACLAGCPVSKVSRGHLAWTSGESCPCPERPAHGHVLSGTHVAGLMTGWVRECIYKRCLQEQIPFYSNLWPVPWSPGRHPLAPPAPLPSGVLSLCHFVILAQTAIYGDSISCLCFLSPLGPWLPSVSILEALSNLPVPGAGRGRREETQLGHTYCSPGPPPHVSTPLTPMPDWPALVNTMGQPADLAFLLFLSKALGPHPPGSPLVPLVGVGISETNLSIVGLS